MAIANLTNAAIAQRHSGRSIACLIIRPRVSLKDYARAIARAVMILSPELRRILSLRSHNATLGGVSPTSPLTPRQT
ncbi:MAG: hypothetical protein AAGD25_22185 [Cyanobacteria bacterium P01_F01_bin.150]